MRCGVARDGASHANPQVANRYEETDAADDTGGRSVCSSAQWHTREQSPVNGPDGRSTQSFSAPFGLSLVKNVEHLREN